MGYENGKIYKLQCSDGYYYIGSTINALSKRLGGHKRDSLKNNGSPIYKYISSIGWNNVKIVLICNCNCNNREELLREEDRYIKEHINDKYCLNNRRAFLTNDDRKQYYNEYRNENKEQIKQYRNENKEQIKQYRNENKEHIAEQQKQYKSQTYTCECGSEIILGNKSRHEKTKKHIDYIKLNESVDTSLSDH